MDDVDNEPDIRLLREISEHRDKLLRELYHMIRLRNNVGSIFKMSEENEQELPDFLARYHLDKIPEGSISTLPENELFLPPPPSPSIPVDSEKPVESDDELDLIGTPSVSVKSTRQSPSIQVPDVAPVLDLQSVSQTSEVLPTMQDSIPTPTPPTETLNAEGQVQASDGDFEPEDEEVTVEGMVVDTSAEALTPDGGVELSEQDAEDAPMEPDKMDVDEAAPTPPPQPPDQSIDEAPSADSAGAAVHTSHQEDQAMEVEQVQLEEPLYSTPSQQAPKLVPLEPSSILESQAAILSAIPSFIPVTPQTQPIMISAPAEPLRSFSSFNFVSDAPVPIATPTTIDPIRTLFNPDYTLPPLKTLPVEFNRKSRPSKLKRKKEKELQKELKGDGDKKGKDKDKDKEKDDFVPLGAMRWGITARVNPVYKRLPKANKCLSTRDWTVGMTELKLIRTLERIDFLKDGRWSFRQPKKQRSLGQTTKTHWDYLLEEMKWMRTDFREERKWKLAVAFNLSTAVLEWHAVESWEERIAKGICVKWKRPAEAEEPSMEDDSAVHESGAVNMEIDRMNADSQKTSMSLGDYGSDDEDDDEQDKQSGIDDPLDAATLLEDALQANESQNDQLQPKTEELDDSSALRDPATMHVDMHIDEIVTTKSENLSTVVIPTEDISKSSVVPASAAKSSGDHTTALSKSKSSKITLYAAVRDKIIYSDAEKLFLDLDDFRVPTNEELPSIDHPSSHLPPADLTSIFPDLQPFALYEPTSSLPPDSKRKSEKKLLDEWKTRVDDTERTKIWPVGKYMHTKPTLLGALQPAVYWVDGQWTNMDIIPVTEDPNTLKLPVPDDCSNTLFDSKMHMTQSGFKDTRKPNNHLWNTAEDNLLKSFVDRYAHNWQLITEMFNSHNPHISGDRRTVRECVERWREKWAPPDKPKFASDASVNGAEETPPPSSSQPPATPMTTRGVKRLASVSVSSPTSNNATVMGSEPKKRRRHLLIQDSIRRVAKRKAEAAQKQNARKGPAVHETHGQLLKMPKYTPTELSRMKFEKENQERMALTQMKAAQAQALQQQQQQQSTQQAQQPAQQNGATSPTTAGQTLPVTAPAVPRAPGVPIQPQTVPQLRNQQVNISQQQRLAAPLSRLSPQQTQQLLQARAAQQLQGQLQGQPLSQQQAAILLQQAHAAAAAQAAQTQGQVTTGQNAVGSSNGVAASYVSRDATSSPHAHTSPPRSTATPSNALNSPRPPSAQAQHTPQMAQAQLQAVQQAVQAQLQNNGMPRGAMGHYYLPPNVAGYTQDQINVLRLQALQQIQLQQQQQQQPQQSTNTSF